MSNPADPHRHHGDDLPRDTSAFEDTEFAYRDGGADGYEAEAVTPDEPDTAGNTGDNNEIVDAEAEDLTGSDQASAPLGSTEDPEMTGIIPVIDDSVIAERQTQDSPDAATEVISAAGAAGAAGATGAADPDSWRDGSGGGGNGGNGGGGNGGNGGTADADGADEPGNGDDATETRPWYARIPSWAWILLIGAVLAVITAFIAMGLMRSDDSTDTRTPYSSVVPSYERPDAWDPDDAVTMENPGSGGGQEYYPEPQEQYVPEENEGNPDDSEVNGPSDDEDNDGSGNDDDTGNGNGNGNGGGNDNNDLPGGGNGNGTDTGNGNGNGDGNGNGNGTGNGGDTGNGGGGDDAAGDTGGDGGETGGE